MINVAERPKFTNAIKIYFLKHPENVFKPRIEDLKRDGLLENIDLEDDEIEELEKINSSKTAISYEELYG